MYNTNFIAKWSTYIIGMVKRMEWDNDPFRCMIVFFYTSSHHHTHTFQIPIRSHPLIFFIFSISFCYFCWSYQQIFFFIFILFYYFLFIFIIFDLPKLMKTNRTIADCQILRLSKAIIYLCVCFFLLDSIYSSAFSFLLFYNKKNRE